MERLKDNPFDNIRTDELYNYMGDDRIVLSRELQDRFSLADSEMGHLTYKLGFPMLDNLIGGVQAGELTVISGITGNGKTLLAQTFTRNLNDSEILPLWFTYEVLAPQFLKNFGSSLPTFCMPSMLKANTIEWIEDKIYESVLKYESKVVFIDHLHYLVDMKMRNVSLEIGFLMRYLKKLAIRYAQSIFIICHMTKLQQDKEPDTENLRDSGMIGCEADNVFFIWRKKSKPQEAILKISKARRTGVMQEKIELIKVGNYLEELSKRREEWYDK